MKFFKKIFTTRSNLPAKEIVAPNGIVEELKLSEEERLNHQYTVALLRLQSVRCTNTVGLTPIQKVRLDLEYEKARAAFKEAVTDLELYVKDSQ